MLSGLNIYSIINICIIGHCWDIVLLYIKGRFILLVQRTGIITV